MSDKRPKAKERNRVLAKYGHSCYWCGIRLIYIQDIPRKKRISVNKAKIFWRGNNKVKSGWLLTFDHVWPKSRGGSTRNNLVPCCFYCNMVRGKYMDKTFRERPNNNGRRNIKEFILHSWTKRVKKYWANKNVALLAE